MISFINLTVLRALIATQQNLILWAECSFICGSFDDVISLDWVLSSGMEIGVL
jgi:hypothetical protein